MEKMQRIMRSYLPILSQKEINDRIKTLSEKTKDDMDILDYLELFDIKCLIDEDKIRIDNSDKISEKLDKTLISEFYRRVNTSTDLLKYFDVAYSDINSKTEFLDFRNTMLDIFETYTFARIVSDDDLEEIIKTYHIPLFKFLKSNYWAKEYPDLIKKIFFSKTEHFELFLDNFTDSKIKNYLPKNITKDEFYSLADRYINDIPSQKDHNFESNLNYLRLLNNNLNGINKFLDVDAELKLRVNEQIDLKNTNLLKKGTVHSSNITVILHPAAKETFDLQFKNGLVGVVDVDFIKSHNDIPSLLTYLKYLSYFFTDNGILNLASFPNVESSAFEKAIGIKPKNNYEISLFFYSKTRLILNELRTFDHFIKVEHNLSFEKIFDYFFKNYSENVFNMKWVHVPVSEEKSFSIKIKILFSSEENIRKQWKVYTKYNSINPKLLNYEKTPDFDELPSLLPNKYIYAETGVSKHILYTLFSDQSQMGYISQLVNESTFEDLITHHAVHYEDFSSYQLTDLNFLIEQNVISKSEDGLMYFDAQQKILISMYAILWSQGVINYYNLPSMLSNSLKNKYQLAIDECLSDGLLKSKSTLFSKVEVDFLNYLLNDKNFDNSKSLRNKHGHGHSTDVDEEYYEDYLYAVAVFLLYIVKINEEFHFQSLLNEEEGYLAKFE